MRYLIIILLLLSFSTNAQNTDEILKLQKELRSDTQTRLKTASKLRFIYAESMKDSLFTLGNYILKKGVEEDNQALMIYGKLITADYYNTTGRTDLSIGLLKECVAYYKRKGDLELLADAQNLMGIAYIHNSEYHEAASWLLKSIKTSDALGKNNEFYMAQLNLTEVYFREEKFDLAEAEILNFIDRIKAQNKPLALKKAYDYLAKIYISKGDTQLGFQYHQKALELALKSDSKMAKAIAYNNVAIAHFENGDLQLAYENFYKALGLRLEINEVLGISESYYNLGDWNYYQDKYKEALPFYQKSLEVAVKNNLYQASADAYEAIADCYAHIGNHKDAYFYLQKYVKELTAIYKKNQKKNLEFQRAAYEIQREEERLKQDKRERKISELVEHEQDRGKVIVIGFSLLIGVLLVFYFFLLARNFRIGKKTKGVVNESLSQESQLKDSKWNKMEHFISGLNYESQTPGNLSDKIKLIQNIHLVPLNTGQYLFWEAAVSKLESYLLYTYIKDNLFEDEGYEAVKLLFEKQNLVKTDLITFGTLAIENDEVLINGTGGLLIQNSNKMSFLSDGHIEIRQFTILVSEVLKNKLITEEKWDKLMEQIDMIQKMSTHMSIQTIEDVWTEFLKDKDLGMMLIYPEPR